MLSEHQWIQASDDDVRARLRAKLAQLREAASAEEALGCQASDDLRKTFLMLTKEHHPNRFARRPDDIRDLASDVFISIKEAYERAQGQRAASQLDVAKANARGGTLPFGVPVARPATSHPPESAARNELKERRREQLKNRLPGAPPTGKRTAQIRAATVEAPREDVSTRDEEEERFAAGSTLLQQGDFEAAAAAFKALAIGRPADKRYRMHMHYAQGRARQSEGHIDEARAEYKRALGMDANFSAAHAAMSSLPDENKKKKSGIMSKLFGK